MYRSNRKPLLRVQSAGDHDLLVEELVTVDKETAALALRKPEEASLVDWDVNVEHFRVAPVSHVADDIEARCNQQVLHGGDVEGAQRIALGVRAVAKVLSQHGG